MNPDSHKPGELPKWLYPVALKIDVHFNDEELRNLCLELGVDYESLSASGKAGKARELVLQRFRHGEIQELLRVLNGRRPNVEFREELTVNNVVRELSPERRKELDYILDNLETRYSALLEWKELHNHLDNILNISFGQYYTQLQRTHSTSLDPEVLIISWSPVSTCIERLLEWAGEIKHIGSCYEEREGQKRGERWAVELCESWEAITDHLGIMSRVNRRNRLSGSQNNSEYLWWWDQAHELSASLDHRLKKHMSHADHKLRMTAAEVYDLSKKLLWRQS